MKSYPQLAKKMVEWDENDASRKEALEYYGPMHPGLAVLAEAYDQDADEIARLKRTMLRRVAKRDSGVALTPDDKEFIRKVAGIFRRAARLMEAIAVVKKHLVRNGKPRDLSDKELQSLLGK